MATAGTLLDFGIAINFFGNYAKEANKIDEVTNNLSNSLLNLKNLIVGGAVAAAIYSFGNSLYHTALTMEQNFARLNSSLGSTTKAMESLEWARRKGAETPFEIEEVNAALGLMTSLGYAKTAEKREKTFNSVGDFAGLHGAGFEEMMSKAARAGFGNWMSLQKYGINSTTIQTQVQERMQATPDKFKGEEKQIASYLAAIKSGKKGTEEYKEAVVGLLGVLGRGGMENRLNTIAGALGNVDDIFKNFAINLMGYTQMQGTFSGAIKDTIKDFLGSFDKLRTDTNKYADGKMFATDMTEKFRKGLTKEQKTFLATHGYIIAQVSAVDQLGRIGKRVGEVLTSTWGGVDRVVKKVTDTIIEYIDKVDLWFSKFEENVAPVILFIALVRIEFEEFLKGFYEGFMFTFEAFLGAAALVWKALAQIAEWMGITDISTRDLGLALGAVLGILLGIKAFKLMTAPLMPLITGAQHAIIWLDKVIIKQRVMSGLSGVIGGKVSSGMTLMRGAFARLIPSLTGAATASWGFTASLLANPITWIVLAVIALVAWIAYLIIYWDEVQASMQGVSDTVLVLLSCFMPIVGLPLLMAKYWTEFKTIFTNIWEGIKAYLQGAWIFIRAKIVEPLQKQFLAVWTGIKTAVSSFVNYIKETFPFLVTIFDAIVAPFKNLWEYVKKIWDMFADSTFIKTILKFVENGSEFRRDMAANYGTEEEKKLYAKVASPPPPPPAPEQKVENNTFTTPAINIYTTPGQNADDISNNIWGSMQQNLSRTGK